MSKPMFYATLDASSIRSYQPDVPVLLPVSSFANQRLRQLARRKGRVRPDVVDQLPIPDLRHLSHIAVDPGGYVATTRWGGRYRYSMEQYLGWLRMVQPCWAGLPDLTCQPLSSCWLPTVPERQEAITETAWWFWERCRSASWAWVPTVQGWQVEDYRAHARALRPLIDEMRRIYEGRNNIAWRVGIGTLCGRRNAEEVRCIIDVVLAELPDVPLHLWGVKLSLLQQDIALPPKVISADSAAWNGRFGRDLEHQKKSGLSQREYAYRVALPSYLGRLHAALLAPKRQRPLSAHPMICPACWYECGETWEDLEADEREEIQQARALDICPLCSQPLAAPTVRALQAQAMAG
ncbi:MAG: hypothetical protein H0T73_05395 [Ardenticatenales bacterium]|nr:hypothetical protein [Ardenticatenales bacterium]